MNTRSDEQRAQTELIKIAEYATALINRSGKREGFRVQPGSPLALDDAASNPYYLSSAVRTSLLAASDHLHAVCCLLLKTEVLHLVAPATLVRGALECASTALWLLAPDTSDERVTRGLRWHLKDASDGDKAATEIGAHIPTPLQVRKDKIKAVADAHGLSFDAIKRGYSSTDAVTAAKAHMSSLPLLDALFTWRLCSGFAHGRFWPLMGFAEVLQTPTGDPEVGMAEMGNSYERVALLTMTATAATRLAVELYDKLSTAP